jgi:hypothetical protein
MPLRPLRLMDFDFFDSSQKVVVLPTEKPLKKLYSIFHGSSSQCHIYINRVNNFNGIIIAYSKYQTEIF